ncbi:ShlB/FhaC/HecB family hemolysin secretion/activation protein [Desulfobacterales bacterium HSG16]|nr:ShlB/FhaC/HecB family hemolysin secretion/activation protein [Desulfobacterales bacterium HSG16]
MKRIAVILLAIGIGFVPGLISKASCQKTVLPTIEQDKTRLSSVASVLVTKFDIRGNTIFTEDELHKLLAPWIGKKISAEELQDAKNAVTRYYIDRGYINSGAVIPDQELRNGVIILKITEGRLTKTKVTGNSWLKDSFVLKRLKPATNTTNEPLNILKLQQRLKLIKQDHRIDNINAELSPGLEPGQAELQVEVDEARPWYLELTFNNHNSPSIGPYRGEVGLGFINLTGWGDELHGKYALTEGLDDYSASYILPLSAKDTTLAFEVERSESVVVAYPFEQLNIKSETDTYSARLRHPFIKTLSKEFALSAKFEVSESKTSLLNEPFSFSPGVVNGESKVAVLRMSQEFVHRSLNQVFALYSSVNFGLDALDSTMSGSEPDSEFISWLGQAQVIRRLKALDSQVLISMNIQLSDDPLLPMEKFAVGGSSSVRGYRENMMTTDNGLTASVEWRIPVFSLKIPYLSKNSQDGMIRFCPFADYGRGWNAEGKDPDPSEIYSIGAGARWSISKDISAEIYWGEALKDPDNTDEYDIQEDGIHFQVKARIF